MPKSTHPEDKDGKPMGHPSPIKLAKSHFSKGFLPSKLYLKEAEPAKAAQSCA